MTAPHLDANDMVCDFKALRLAIESYLDQFDHAMAINSSDKALAMFRERGDRLVVVPNQDPTTEVLARLIYEEVASKVGREFAAKDGVVYRLPPHLAIERVRVSETATTWAEYAP